MQARDDLKNWDFQSPPTGLVPQIGMNVPEAAKLPHFGPYERQRRKLIEQKLKSADLLEVSHAAPHTQSTNGQATKSDSKPVPKIKDQIGRALPRIGNYNSLNNKEQAVALVDESLCINCGKCYMTCNDSGYQAITFDSKTHLPHVTTDCTGCTLCVSVCPVINCIT